MQRLPAITHDRFGLFRFRSPLLTESLLLSLPVGTEMFHFPTFPLPALYIQAGVTRSSCNAWRGFPIRKSSDQSSIISSPRLIADLYVLLRLQMPRHPPFALRNLMTKLHKEQCNVGKTDAVVLNEDITEQLHTEVLIIHECLRCSRPLCSSQITGGTHPNPPPTANQAKAQSYVSTITAGPVPQDPTACTRPDNPNHPVPTIRKPRTGGNPTSPGHNVNVPPMSATGKQMLPK